MIAKTPRQVIFPKKTAFKADLSIKPSQITRIDSIEQRLDGVIQPLTVADGWGVDSIAMLIWMSQMYHAGYHNYRPGLITFANTGGEKPQTYCYGYRVHQPWLSQVGFPGCTIVRYKPERVKHGMYHTLEENCLVNRCLPSIAYNFIHKKCSQKWKRAPQDKLRESWGPAKKCWAEGSKVLVCIGYDAGPADARRKGIADDDQYQFIYPLRELGWDRDRCIWEIRRAGLPGWANEEGWDWQAKGGIPVKSACYYCPSSKPEEITRICQQFPHFGQRIVRMETNASPNLEGNMTQAELDVRYAAKMTKWREDCAKAKQQGKPQPKEPKRPVLGKGVKGLWASERMTDYIEQTGALAHPHELPILPQFDFPTEQCNGCDGCY